MLLDELEKGHSDVLNILLQIMEDGILTDGKGRTVNFKNCILVMTSNVGSKRILEVADKSMASKVSTAPSTSMTQSTSPNVDPLRPDEVMTRLQKNPDAMAMRPESGQTSPRCRIPGAECGWVAFHGLSGQSRAVPSSIHAVVPSANRASIQPRRCRRGSNSIPGWRGEEKAAS